MVLQNVDGLELIGYGYAVSVDKADLSYGKVVALHGQRAAMLI